MIARTRVLQFKQFDSEPGGTTLRLTAKSGQDPNSDTFVVMRFGGDNEKLEKLIQSRGRMFRVTIEEVE